ncbi:hypothetical protein AX15_005393 [Amanita polypyramis BW_CC]|nr:hypothetical protein AX15_005393 [Amanita polypyramis BW_CC]
MILHKIARSTIAIVAVDTRRYIDWADALHRYFALFGWTLTIWITWTPLIAYRSNAQAGSGSTRAIGLAGRVLFAGFICSAILLCEKILIQWIAEKFHKRSYADRITDQKFAVHTLVTLYRDSSDMPGRSNTLNMGHVHNSSVDAKRLFRRLGSEVRKAATATTTALGNVASEIAGSSVLQPNSPQAMVKTALQSANKSRALALRLFYSFRKPGSEYLYFTDIQPFFSPQVAQRVFALFDRDENGNVSRQEMEMACLDFHKEQLSLEYSMRDLDSAVGKLDNILMSVYSIVAIVLMAVALEAQLQALVTGTGSLVLGLSWLIGASMQEILASIIFLFVKHPYDVGDRVQINRAFYTVQEINLLYTVFMDSDSAFVQAPNSILNTLWIQNIRRSKEMSETFSFIVGYDTSFQDLERFRDQMLVFLQSEKRDFQPVFDLTVQDLTDQSKMSITTKIMYKSNWQSDATRVKRRNKWVCTLKKALADTKIYGPGGAPGSYPEPTSYTQIPWEDVKAERGAEEAKRKDEVAEPIPTHGWRLTAKDATLLESANDGIFGGSPVPTPLVSPRQGVLDGRLGQMTTPKETFEMTETTRSNV